MLKTLAPRLVERIRVGIRGTHAGGLEFGLEFGGFDERWAIIYLLFQEMLFQKMEKCHCNIKT